MKAENRLERILGIFFRSVKGEELSVNDLADEYQVSSKSISRDISEIKNFLAEHRDITGNAELEYSYQSKTHRLTMDSFLKAREIMALVEILIGSRAIDKLDLIRIINKLKQFTMPQDRQLLESLIAKETREYQKVQVKIGCKNLLENIWRLNKYIYFEKEITIRYTKMDESTIERRIKPLSIMFTDYYFYLIAVTVADEEKIPKYYRIDRITDFTEHREALLEDDSLKFDEGELRKKSLLMWPGPERKILFEFTGPSWQAVLDKIPTANIIDEQDGKYIVEAKVYGDGIKMFLLSQGSWVKVLRPESFVDEMKDEIAKMAEQYEQADDETTLESDIYT